MDVSNRPARIGLAAYPQSQSAAILGLQDLFAVASQFQQEQADCPQPLETEIVRDFTKRNHQFSAVILPPALGQGMEDATEQELAGWVRHYHKQGALICSICAGAFPLAASGLLDGRQATTHWALTSELVARFPAVRLEAERLIIDDGDVITAGGLMAWTDLGLRLIARFLGPAVMFEVARFFLIDPGERLQSFYRSFSPSLTHGDDAALRVQHWLQATYQTVITVPEMARVARLEERTFGRRFQAATGWTPSEYLQQLRIGKARERLELSQASVEVIARDVGYLDVSAFRRMFHKIVGLTPGDYRKRFAPARV